MKQDTISNLFSEHRLKDTTLDFLENIKFLKHQIETPEKFELISYVNNNSTIVKKIFDSYYETGFCNTFKLKPSKNKTQKYNYFEVINNDRKSTRSFSDKAMSFKDLSDFLNLFYKITGKENINLHNEDIVRKTRNIASGGSLYPTEIYIVNNKIEEMPQGIYRYNVYNTELEQIKDFKETKNRDLFNDAMMNNGKNKSSVDYENTSFFIIFTSVINKHSFKYQDFGVILSLVEIGEFIHSAYLTSSTLDIGCCAYGGFLNNKMNSLLELKNNLHIPFISMAVGNKKSNKNGNK
jgi:SagB-type dehydrogenase family enzyme